MRYYLSILLSICVLNSFSQTNTAIRRFTDTQGFENASLGVCIKDLSGNEIVSYNKNFALTPASTLKVVTTAASLEMLGDDYKFRTVLSVDRADPQHIIVRGYGDPTLGSEYLNDNVNSFLDMWANKIKAVVNTTKPVKLEIDDSYFGYSGVSRKWIQEDLGNYYAAGAYGISVFDNAHKLYFNTTDTESPPVIVKTEPEIKDLVFTNLLGTNTQGKDNGYINGETFSNERKLVGDIPAKRKSFSIKGVIPDPGLYLGQALAKRLMLENVPVSSVSTVRSYYYTTNPQLRKLLGSDEEEIYMQYSAPLRDIIRVVNVRSNNHYTEHLIRAIGKSGDEGDLHFNPLDEGISKIKNLFMSKGLNANALFMYDGCGLAPSNKVTPAILCDILVYMQSKSKYADAFLPSLPEAGKEGTVRNLLKGTRLSGKVFVKSGSIADVQCFTGYYIDGGKKYAFSVMVNNYTCERRDVVKAIENLLLSVLQ